MPTTRAALVALAWALAGLAGAAGAADRPPAWSDAAVRAFAGASRDSDEVVLHQHGIEFDALAFGAVRLGLRAERARLTDPTGSATADAWALQAQGQTSPSMRIDGLAGIVRLAPGSAGASVVDRPQAAVRLRWRPAGPAPAAELRWTRRPLIASPALLVQRVDLDELRAAITAPLGGPFLARASLQRGLLDESRQTNRRVGYELAGLRQLAPSVEIGLAYGELGYRHRALSPYSAPRRLRTVQLATYGEWEALGPLALTLDAGIGRQQVSRHDEPPRGWTGMFRLLAQLSWPVVPGTRLELGFERNDSPLGGHGSGPGAAWRSQSLALGLRVSLGR